MSFRQNNESHRKWKTWLDAHQKTLLDCGVPLLVVEDQKLWSYFLDHGHYTPLINVDSMPHEKAEKLCIFLEGPDSTRPDSTALNRLQYLLSRGRHAKSKA